MRVIAADVTAQEAPAIDAEFLWPQGTMRAMQSEGLGGLVIPSDCGGLGFGMRGLVKVCEILGYESGSAGITFGMHAVGSAVIAAQATKTHIEEYLEPISEGRHITSLALSEPGTGSSFWLPETAMLPTSGGFLLEGVKSFVTNGGMADSYVVNAVAPNGDLPVGHFSCVVLKEGTTGMQWGEPWRGVGMRGNSSRALTLAGVELPEGNLLGKRGEQIWYVFQIIAPYFLAAMAGTYLGIAQRALDEAISGLRTRSFTHTGSGPASLDVIQHRLGTLWMDVARSRRLSYWAAAEADRHGPESLPALCAAKADIASTAVTAAHRALALLGGRAYGEAGTIERLMRDALAADVMSPTTDILLTWAGRALLDQPLLGE